MSGGRDAILGNLRRGLKRRDDDGGRSNVEQHLKGHERGLIPARAQKPKDEQVALFIEQVEAVAGTTARLSSPDDIPEALAAYLRSQNLPSEVKLAPHADLRDLPWQEKAPAISLSAGPAVESDQVSLTRAFAGVAETGTLAKASGPESPTTLNFLPENNVVVLRESDIVGTYEEVWDRLRARYGEGRMPRTLNYITGPSRTADIEQTIQLGAHGPRRLHILIVKDDG